MTHREQITEPAAFTEEGEELLFDALSGFAQAQTARSVRQVVGTLAGFILSVLIPLSSSSIWLWIIGWIIGLVMLMRLVIIQHDCGHRSLFTSSRLNRWVGHLLSPLTTLPFGYWQLSHDIHHRNQSDLDARSETEYPTLTVTEYLALSPREQRRYRLIRSPIGVCLLVPLVVTFGIYRFPNRIARSAGLSLSMFILDFFLIGLWGGSLWFIGTQFALWLVTMQLTLICAAFLFFYFQHQYEDAYWAERDDFDFVQAGLRGSSFLDTHPLIHWCTGQIGYHHIHHLACGIPNYALPDAHKACLDLGYTPSRLRLRDVPRTLSFALWDVQLQQLIPFDHLKSSELTPKES